VLTIVDVAALILGQPTPADRRGLAIISDIAGHSYGLMVDAVADICTVSEGRMPVRGRIDPAWAPYARGTVDYEGQPCLLVSLNDFVESAPSAQAA
jgi:purine-binding chemotaxis protein CheW